jgi:hypothetical protein
LTSGYLKLGGTNFWKWLQQVVAEHEETVTEPYLQGVVPAGKQITEYADFPSPAPKEE